ncbi:MAG: GTPase Era [Erysipelotrichaceae bacterium]|nr:GTPase Era [Erysipelotrichaceae bacterium]
MGFVSGFVAIIGRPNAGKSTLMNSILQQKIAITTPKAQTTRNNIRGILTEEDAQIIFVDTPGIHKPQHQLGEEMVKEAWSSLSGVDLVYFIVDVSKEFGTGDEYILKQLESKHLPVILVLNKIDLLTKEQLIQYLENFSHKFDFKEIIPISALKEDNIDRLLEVTKTYLTDTIQYYPEGQVCDYPEQFIMAEIIREKILLNTRDEIPHSVAIVIERIVSKKDKTIINAMIMVERDSQKGIIIGKQGAMLKRIGMQARKELETIVGTTVYLELFVRVEKDWRNRRAKLLQLGYIQTEIDDE